VVKYFLILFFLSFSLNVVSNSDILYIFMVSPFDLCECRSSNMWWAPKIILLEERLSIDTDKQNLYYRKYTVKRRISRMAGKTSSHADSSRHFAGWRRDLRTHRVELGTSGLEYRHAPETTSKELWSRATFSWLLQVMSPSACSFVVLVSTVFHYMFRPTWPSSSV
jgi:hypothetical protein